MFNEGSDDNSFPSLLEIKMNEQINWRVTPFKDGYKISFVNDTVEISIFTDDCNNIEKFRKGIINALDAINATCVKNDEHFVSLPSLTPCQKAI